MEKFSFRFNIANKVNLQIILNLSEILDDYAHTSERPLIVFNMDNDECIEISIEEAYLAIKDKEKSILSIAIDRLCSIFIS